MSGRATTERGRRGFARRNGWLVALAGLVAVLAVVTGVAWIDHGTALDVQRAQIQGLEGELRQAQTKNAERIDGDVLAAIGVSRSRLAHDAPILTDLARTAFTWNSGVSYEQARADIKDRFGLTEQDPFLTGFMPPSRYSTDASGKRYYYIDAEGMNSSVSRDPSIEVVSVAAGDYRYAVVVDVDVTSDAVENNNSNKGQHAATRRALLFVTVDAEGDVSGVSGVPASGSTRHSS